jgi:hypothetical protein
VEGSEPNYTPYIKGCYQEEQGAAEITLEKAMRWMERADERTYQKTGRFASGPAPEPTPTTSKSTDPGDPDAMEWGANAIKAGWKPVT